MRNYDHTYTETERKPVFSRQEKITALFLAVPIVGATIFHILQPGLFG